MAIFKTGAIVGGISGKVGGATFVNGRGSGVVRISKRHGNAQSPEQTFQTGKFQNAILRWKELSPEDKKLWNVASATRTFSNRLGEKRLISGYQYFLRAQAIIDIDTPPAQATDAPEVEVDFLSTVTSGLQISVNVIDPSAIIGGQIRGMILWRSTDIKFQNFYKSIGNFSFSGSHTISFNTQWQQKFPLPLLGQYVALRYDLYSDFIFTGQTVVEIIETTA